MKEVYVDLDGVLADFEKEFNEKYAILADLSYPELVEYKKKFADDAFFLDLPIMDEAYKLLLYIEDKGYKPTILTSVGKYNSEAVAEQKQAWLDTNFNLFDFKGFRWVTTSTDKAKYVKDENSILIDDRTRSTDAWTEAGGTAVLYNGLANSMNDLEKVL